MKENDESFREISKKLAETGRSFFQRGWVPATSGNFSAKFEKSRIAITVSGKNKGELSPDDIMEIDLEGKSADGRKSSAETPLHVMIYKNDPASACVLHSHSVNSTLISKHTELKLHLEDYEILKAFKGIETHQTSLEVPIFPNDQDTVRLAEKVEKQLKNTGPGYGFLIAGHGLYAWGGSIEDARRHLEAFEFLFECEITKRKAGWI